MSSFFTAIAGGSASNVNVVSSVLPTGASTEATLSALNGKFPSAITLSDAIATPSATQVGSFEYVWDGSVWQRQRGGVTAATTTPVGFANVLNSGIYLTAAPTLTNGQYSILQLDVNGNLKTAVSGLGTAAAIADATTNPTVVGMESYNMALNGSNTWDRNRSNITGTITTSIGFQDVIVPSFYRATRPTLADGNATELQANTRGDLSIAEQFQLAGEDGSNQLLAVSNRLLANGQYSPSILLSDFATTITKNCKASPGIVTSIVGKNRNVAIRWLQIHSTITVPSTSAVPLLSIEVAPGTQIICGQDFFTPMGLKCTVGIAYAWSTASNTYQAANASDHDTQVMGI